MTHSGHAIDQKPRADDLSARGLVASSLRNYFEPVVPLLGLGEQVWAFAFASFSQAARLAYLQFNAPPAVLVMQNLALPMVCEPFIELLFIELALSWLAGLCALAIDMPAIRAATAVRAVRVFIFMLLEDQCRGAAPTTTGSKELCSKKSRGFETFFRMGDKITARSRWFSVQSRYGLHTRAVTNL
jgi:hypothetical protein